MFFDIIFFKSPVLTSRWRVSCIQNVNLILCWHFSFPSCDNTDTYIPWKWIEMNGLWCILVKSMITDGFISSIFCNKLTNVKKILKTTSHVHYNKIQPQNQLSFSLINWSGIRASKIWRLNIVFHLEVIRSKKFHKFVKNSLAICNSYQKKKMQIFKQSYN